MSPTFQHSINLELLILSARLWSILVKLLFCKHFSSEWLLRGKFLIQIIEFDFQIPLIIISNIPGVLQRFGRWLSRTRLCLILSNRWQSSNLYLLPNHWYNFFLKYFEISTDLFRYLEIWNNFCDTKSDSKRNAVSSLNSDILRYFWDILRYLWEILRSKILFWWKSERVRKLIWFGF